MLWGGGESYLLANSGQLVSEAIEFITLYFCSTSDIPTQLIEPPTLKLLGGNWGDFGFLIGDSVPPFSFSDGQGNSSVVTDRSLNYGH